MQLVTIGAKYQIVIPKEIRKKNKNIKPGNKVAVKSLNGERITIIPVKKNWSDENYGSLKKYWQGKNMLAEVEKIRNEWD